MDQEDVMQRSTHEEPSRWRPVLGAVWAPIPWMLEAMFVLLLALRDYAGMTAVAALLAINAAVSLGEGYARARLLGHGPTPAGSALPPQI